MMINAEYKNISSLESKMEYVYKCPHCNKETVISKPMSQSDRIEHCEICESILQRVYNAPSIATADGIKK